MPMPSTCAPIANLVRRWEPPAGFLIIDQHVFVWIEHVLIDWAGAEVCEVNSLPVAVVGGPHWRLCWPDQTTCEYRSCAEVLHAIARAYPAEKRSWTANDTYTAAEVHEMQHANGFEP